METQAPASKSLHPLTWVAGIALILFSAAGIGAFMGWIPISIGKPGDDAVLTKHDLPRAGPAKVVPAKKPAAPLAAVKCAECGVIQSVHEIDAKGEGSGIGAVGGAVVGGAIAGNEIEKRVKSAKSYEITVRFDDGTSRAFTAANAPAWRNGDKVKVINGVIQSNA